MAKRQREWARRKRQELIGLLGGCCVKCGSVEHLEFDCINPQGDEHHKMESSTRMGFYRKQYEAGNLQVLCAPCHVVKSASETQLYYASLSRPMTFKDTLRFGTQWKTSAQRERNVKILCAVQ